MPTKWKIRISDSWCEYEYDFLAKNDDISISDLAEMIQEKLQAEPCEGQLVSENRILPKNKVDDSDFKTVGGGPFEKSEDRVKGAVNEPKKPKPNNPPPAQKPKKGRICPHCGKRCQNFNLGLRCKSRDRVKSKRITMEQWLR